MASLKRELLVNMNGLLSRSLLYPGMELALSESRYMYMLSVNEYM